AHLQHQFAGKVEEGDNPAPVEVAVGKHIGCHSEKDLAGGVCVDSCNHPAGKRTASAGQGNQAECRNLGSQPIPKRRKLRPKPGCSEKQDAIPCSWTHPSLGGVPHLGHALSTAHKGCIGELGSDAAGEAGMDPSWVLEQHSDSVIHTWRKAQHRTMEMNWMQ
ncbi:hypothetical protein MC885_014792, partial [Smutsia gigantea]